MFPNFYAPITPVFSRTSSCWGSNGVPGVANMMVSRGNRAFQRGLGYEVSPSQWVKIFLGEVFQSVRLACCCTCCGKTASISSWRWYLRNGEYPPPVPEPAGVFILAPQPPELWGNRFLFFIKKNFDFRFGTLNPKWGVSIRPLCSGLRKLCRRRGVKTGRARVDGRHKGIRVFQTQQAGSALELP